MLLKMEESQWVVLDFQQKLVSQVLEAQTCLDNAARIVQLGRIFQIPGFYTEQNPSQWGPTVAALQAPLLAAQARRLAKMQWSAVEEGLSEWLRPQPKPVQGNARSLPKHLQKAVVAPERNAVVLAGLEAHISVLQTALDLVEDDFEVWVVTDACSARRERDRDAAFDRLAGAGVELITTEMLAYEWLRSAEHPAYADVQALLA